MPGRSNISNYCVRKPLGLGSSKATVYISARVHPHEHTDTHTHTHTQAHLHPEFAFTTTCSLPEREHIETSVVSHSFPANRPRSANISAECPRKHLATSRIESSRVESSRVSLAEEKDAEPKKPKQVAEIKSREAMNAKRIPKFP